MLRALLMLLPFLRRRALLVGVLLVAWRLLALLVRAGSKVFRDRPQRIGNWFRVPDARHEEVYTHRGRMRYEQARAVEEGWRVVSERTTPSGIVVEYERIEPALGHSEIRSAARSTGE